MQITTPFYREGGALGLTLKERLFETRKWPIGVGRLPREGGVGRQSSPLPLPFFPSPFLQSRVFNSLFFLPPIPNKGACSHPTSSNNTSANKEENMSCTR